MSIRTRQDRKRAKMACGDPEKEIGMPTGQASAEQPELEWMEALERRQRLLMQSGERHFSSMTQRLPIVGNEPESE